MKYINQNNLLNLLEIKYNDKFLFLKNKEKDLLEKINNNEEIGKLSGWKDIKEVLKKEYGGYCWFCECSFGSSYFGDIEHYRPKNQVKDVDSHTGYNWLAYDIKNYILTCKLCNSNYEGFGKGTSFEILGTRAFSKDDELSHENPKLLSPYNIADIELLSFDTINGKVSNIHEVDSENYKKVDYTSKLILDRDTGLRKERKDTLKSLERNLIYYEKEENPETKEKFKNLIIEIMNEKKYYLAKYLLIKERDRELINEFNLELESKSESNIADIIEKKKIVI